jgi:hypothetical protein
MQLHGRLTQKNSVFSMNFVEKLKLMMIWEAVWNLNDCEDCIQLKVIGSEKHIQSVGFVV